MQNRFRTIPRRDPFAQARREMAYRLAEIQEDIVPVSISVASEVQGRGAEGNHAEGSNSYSKTMWELVEAEPDLQGKINKLIIFAEQIELNQFEEDETDDCSIISESPSRLRRDEPYRPHYFPAVLNKSTQISQTENERRYTEKDYSQVIDKGMIQSHGSFGLDNSYSKNPQLSNMEHSRHSRAKNKKGSQESQLSFTDKDDLIGEEDLFSFRTQGAVSPIRQGAITRYRDSLVSEEQSKEESKQSLYYPLTPKDKKNLARSKSKSKSSKKSRSHKSPNKPCKSRQQYDGVSLIYQPNQKSRYSRTSTVSKAKTVQLTQKRMASLYNRIKKRIELSRCVVDLISHSNLNTDAAYLNNRYGLEVHARAQLSYEICCTIVKADNWRY